MVCQKRKFKQLDQTKRDLLYQHYSAGIGVQKVAKIIGVHRSSIYRELSRNKHPEHNKYLPDTAQTLSVERKGRHDSKIECSKQLQ